MKWGDEMYGISTIFTIFMLSILCFSGTSIWFVTNKRVPTKRSLHKGTHLQTYTRNYNTKVMK